MKQRILAILITIIYVAVLSYIGYMILSSAQVKTVPLTAEEATDIYANAVSQIDLSQDSVLNITVTKEITVDNSVFRERWEQTVQYDVQPSGETFVQRQKNLTTGAHSISITEVFAQDSIYLTVNNASFVSACNKNSYYADLIPAVLLDATLYNSILGVDTGSEYALTFSEPIAAENWISAEAVILQDASGTAIVDYDGRFIGAMYAASFQQNSIPTRITVDLTVSQTDTHVSIPDTATGYTQIADWRAPEILERACGFLVQARSISSQYTDSIYFQAIGDRRTQNITLHTLEGENLSVSIATETTLANDSKLDQQTYQLKQELFLDDQYTVSTDNASPVPNANVTESAMRDYYQDRLVSTIMLPQYIQTAEVTEKETTIQILFTGTSAFADFLAKNACQILYQNPDLIQDTGKNLTAETLQAYLEIDRYSYLPINSGIHFSGSYQTEGLPYQLHYQADQSYQIPSSNAFSAIEKAADD